MKIIKKITRKKGLFILFSLIFVSAIGFPILHYLYKKRNSSEERKQHIPKKSTKIIDEKKDQSWQEIQNFAQDKNLKEVDFNHYKNQIYHQTNNKDLEQKKQKILAEISELANSTSETERKAKQKEFQDQEERERKEKETEEKKTKEEHEIKEKKEREQQKELLGEWIKGDDIYNFYNSLEKEKEKGILLLDPLYLGGVAKKKGEEFSSSIKRLVEKKLNKNNLVFMPANQTNLHWSLIVYEKNTRTLHLYDSLNSLNFNYFSPLCEELLKNITSPSFIKQEKTPQQTNGNDCGVYVMSITDFLLKRYKNNSSKMNWEISDSEATQIHKYVQEKRRKLNI